MRSFSIRSLPLVLLVVLLALVTTAWLGARTTSAVQATGGQPAVYLSPVQAPTSTPNLHCGVAGSDPSTLAALKLSVGVPEPGGYVWDALIPGNEVQMVRPCRYYIQLNGGIEPLGMRHDCYAIEKGRIQGDDLRYETEFLDWVRSHTGRTWIIGNEPNMPGQDNMRDYEYADMFHYYWTKIKGVDPTAKVAIAGVSQIDLTGDPMNRYTWLTKALNSYKERYGMQIPIDVWNFHMYNLLGNSNYDVLPVEEPITAFVSYVRQTRGYVTQPIWLTEWGKLDGWGDPATRRNAIPDDLQHPQMTDLIRNWATWMQQDGKIARWFWFVTTMGDWNKDFEFDQTGWLFQETNHYYAGTAAANSTATVVRGVPPPASPADWSGAQFAGKPITSTTWFTVTVSTYDAGQQFVTLSAPIPGYGSEAPYRIMKTEYPTWQLNSLGTAYSYFCNPWPLTKRKYLPLMLLAGESATGSMSTTSSSQTAELAATQVSVNDPASSDTVFAPRLFDSPFPPPTQTPAPTDHLLIDDFEYDDSPTVHGWSVESPQGELSTLKYKFDSRKLITTSIHGGDRNFSFTYPSDSQLEKGLNSRFPYLSFDVADSDSWWVKAKVRATNGQDYYLLYKPDFSQPSLHQKGQEVTLEYGIGPGYLDNQWRRFGRDLAKDIMYLIPNVQLQTVERLTFNGVAFLDNVVLEQAPSIEDTSAPQVELKVDGMRSSERSQYYSTVKFTVTADDSDTGSGVQAVFVRLDNNDWLEDYGETWLIETKGRHVLEAYAVDRLGNLSAKVSQTVQIADSNGGK